MGIIDHTYTNRPAWTNAEKYLFRFTFLYFILQAFPLDWKYYRLLFSIRWTDLSYGDIFYITRYQPTFFAGGDTFLNWAVLAGIALIGAIVWSLRDNRATGYDRLYYWLRVLLRYRLALGILGYGFIKFFPLQAPFPSISNLNTAYGDFTAWKLFSLSLGIVPSYESFLGLVEIIGALLLLNRKTATIGTLVILPFTGNVFVSNLAYEGGEYVYSLYLIVIALYLFAFDAVRLFTLISLEKATLPNRFKPVLSASWQRSLRVGLKAAFVLFFVGIYGYKAYAGYKKGPYHFPAEKGLAGTAGLYNVREFKVNNTVLPYSETDPVRWQDVVFENWATISIKSNQPVPLEEAGTEEIYKRDEDRNYELAGSGGRHYYHYSYNPASGQLVLKNRNKALAGDVLTLRFEQPDSTQIYLHGTNSAGDSLHIALEKINRKYLLKEARKTGRRQRVVL